jgi:hypothetical protein
MSPGRPSQKKPAKWPFWLLVAAWWCANAPQAATYEAILWLKGAVYFSHQAELRADVVAILTGVPKVAVARGQGGQILRETPLPGVPLPKNVAIKRVGLCLQVESISPVGQAAVESMRWLHDQVPERRTSPPWLRPPRLA